MNSRILTFWGLYKWLPCSDVAVQGIERSASILEFGLFGSYINASHGTMYYTVKKSVCYKTQSCSETYSEILFGFRTGFRKKTVSDNTLMVSEREKGIWFPRLPK